MSLHLPNDLAAAAMRLFETMVGRPEHAPHSRKGYRPERHYMRGPGPACQARLTQNGLQPGQ